MTLLRIDASPRFGASASRALADRVEAALAPARTIRRDLADEPLPQIDAAWVAARLIPAADQSEADRATLTLSDRLVQELKAADTVLISSPIYNFGVPAGLKAWIDLIARPKVTFAYSEGGPVGLLEGKRATLAMASGGSRIDGPGDFATPYLRHVLGFVGITDVLTLTKDSDLSVLEDRAALA